VDDFWTDGSRWKIAEKMQFGVMTAEFWRELCKQPAAAKRSAYCIVHDKQCEHPLAHTHLAGIICVSWSPMGSCLGVLGQDYRLYCSWVALRRQIQETYAQFRMSICVGLSWLALLASK